MAVLFILFKLIILVKLADVARTHDCVVFCGVELHIVSGKNENQYR